MKVSALAGAALTAPSERVGGRIARSLEGLQPGIGPGAAPWHRRPGAMLRRAGWTLAPTLAICVVAIGGTAAWVASRGEPVGPTLTMFGSVAIAVGGVTLWLLPLGLDGRTSSPAGRSAPLDSSFRDAWRLLPVDPVELRRVALRQARTSLAVTIGLLLGLWALLPGAELSARPTIVGGVVAAMAACPILVASTLGTIGQRKQSNTLIFLLFPTLLLWAFGPVLSEDATALRAICSVLLGAALVVSIGLQRALVRPASDELARP